MLETQQKTIGDCVYEVTPLPASKGLLLMKRIGGVLLPALATAPSLASLGGNTLEVLAALATRLSDADLEHLFATMGAATRALRANAPPRVLATTLAFDEHFAGDYGAIIAWVTFALEVNYARFLDGLKRAPAAAPAASPQAPKAAP